MRPTFVGMEVQKRTLQMAQKSLDITGNNISNINTVGYTRQRVDLYSMYVSGNQSLRWCSSTNNLSLTGQGVNSYGVSQIRDVYIDKRYRENVGIEAETETTVNILSDIEDVIDDFESDGLQYYTQQFFNALQDYSVETPDSTDVATIVVNNATNLCRLLYDYSTQLSEVEETYVSELEDTVDYINNLVETINNLNQKIAKELINYNEGYGPNELYDELNMYIDELATYADIDVTENSNGTYSIAMAGQTDNLLVDGVNFKTNRIIMLDYESSGIATLKFESSEELNPSTGTLRSYINTINGNGVYATGNQNSYCGIAYYKSAINEFARTLASVFNSANGADEDSSRAMFTTSDGSNLITAANIQVSEAWSDDPTMIGKVRTFNEETALYEYGYDEVTDETNGTVTLQNTNVLYLISQLDNDDIKFGNCNDFQGSFYDYISFVSNRLAEDIQYETSRYDAAVTTVDTLLDSRDSVSGVQLDEEGINMLNYQKWYSASSRMVTTLDDILDRLINNTGRVGL